MTSAPAYRRTPASPPGVLSFPAVVTGNFPHRLPAGAWEQANSIFPRLYSWNATMTQHQERDLMAVIHTLVTPPEGDPFFECHNALSENAGRALNTAETLYDNVVYINEQYSRGVFSNPVPTGMPVVMHIGQPKRLVVNGTDCPIPPEPCAAATLRTPDPPIGEDAAYSLAFPYIWFSHFVDPQSDICQG